MKILPDALQVSCISPAYKTVQNIPLVASSGRDDI